MKTKFRILERHYDDGAVKFFPQMGDWWNGWRFLAEPSPSYEIYPKTYVYDSYAEAEQHIKRLMTAVAKGNKKRSLRPSHYPVKTIIHKFDCQV